MSTSLRLARRAAGGALYLLGPLGLAWAADAGGPPKPSLWHDNVHYLGIASPCVAVIVLTLGLTIFFGLRRRGVGYDDAPRRTRRGWHIALGVTAVALAAGHATGRFIQAGDFALDQPAPDLTILCFLIVGLAGIFRALLPSRHAAALTVFAWCHRVGVVGALTFVTIHAGQMTLHHLAKLAAG
jgi:hypothetical protein